VVKSRRNHRRTRSFALVDCIVATIMLGVSLSVIIGLAGRAVSSQAEGDRLATAAMLADEQLHLVLARGPDGYQQNYGLQGQCDEPFQDYKYTLSFSGGASVGDPYAVSCTIAWNAGGRDSSISVDTLIAPRTGSSDTQPDPVRTPQQAITRTPGGTTP